MRRMVIAVVRIVSCREKWSDYGVSGVRLGRRSGEDDNGVWSEGYARLVFMPLSSTSLWVEGRGQLCVP